MGLFVIFAPSGTGKTSLATALVESELSLSFSVSHTTRQMRSGEKNGVDYIFTNKQEFLQLQQAGGFVEHAEVYGNWYGTGCEQLNKQLDKGSVLLEIDWQGAKQIKAAIPEANLIGILPPNIEEVRRRLQQRGQDNADVIEQRMQTIGEEIKHLRMANYLVRNDDFSKALADLRAITRAHSLEYELMQSHYKKLVEEI